MDWRRQSKTCHMTWEQKRTAASKASRFPRGFKKSSKQNLHSSLQPTPKGDFQSILRGAMEGEGESKEGQFNSSKREIIHIQMLGTALMYRIVPLVATANYDFWIFKNGSFHGKIMVCTPLGRLPVQW